MLTRLRPKLNILVAVIFAFAVLSLVIQTIFRLPPLSIPTDTRMREHVSNTGHFKISYPAGWVARETPEGIQNDKTIIALIDFPKIPPPGASVLIRRSTVAFESLAQVVEWGEGFARKEPGFQVISSQSLMVGGEDTQLDNIKIQTPATPLQSTQEVQCYGNYRLHKRTGYALSFCSQSDDFVSVQQTFLEMIQSFGYLD